MSVKNKIEFEVEYAGKQVQLASVRPNAKVQEQAQLIYAAAFAKYVQAGGLLKKALDDYLVKNNIWGPDKQQEYEALFARMAEAEKKLPDAAGRVRTEGVTVKMSKEAAIQLRRERVTLRNLLMERNELEANTVEEQAKQHRFNYLVSACTVYKETGKPFFASYDDYLNRAEEPASIAAAGQFALLHYQYDPNEEHKLPENVFLKRFKMCNDKLHLIDAQGRLVDTEGRLVNEDGRYINEAGEFIDIKGDPVSETGEPIVETYPLLDDDGNPAEIPSETVEPAQPKPAVVAKAD